MSRKPYLGKMIREQRKKQSLTLNQLAKLSGVSVAHLGRIEQGQRGASTLTLQKIAEPLGFDLYELLVMTGHLSLGLSFRRVLKALLSNLHYRKAYKMNAIRAVLQATVS